MTSPLLGCIADDYTGATDLASNLVEAGMRVVQTLGVPASRGAIAGADAVVIALKTRSVHRNDAVRQSLEALHALQAMGAQRYYFKYCSTFDSTDEGNIGPVAEALLETLAAPQTIFCPAFPDNARTVYNGHLFVSGRLLNESGMEHHPLNPMTDSHLVRLLSKQTKQNVDLLPYSLVQDGADSIRHGLRVLWERHKPLVIIDALSNDHLRSISLACADMPLVTGGSGLAIELPNAYRMSGLLSGFPSKPEMPSVIGRTAILSGSCSKATQDQVAFMQSRCLTYPLDVQGCIRHPESAVDAIVQWAIKQTAGTPILIYSTAESNDVASVQSEFGRELSANAIESAFATIARRLVDQCQVRRMIVAGGETSGAVVSQLGVRTLRIGPRIVAGVPWTESIDGQPLALALKSGNFGAPDFFQKAMEMFV
jgi:uncharacterized protein YgbK (DUF1537 family)